MRVIKSKVVGWLIRLKAYKYIKVIMAGYHLYITRQIITSGYIT